MLEGIGHLLIKDQINLYKEGCGDRCYSEKEIIDGNIFHNIRDVEWCHCKIKQIVRKVGDVFTASP